MDHKKFQIRPNFFDILFVVIILAIAAGAYMVSHKDTDETVSRRSYTVELVGIAKGLEVSVEPGDTVIDNVMNLEMGVITDVRVEPATFSEIDEETYTEKQVPEEDYITLILTIESDTTESDYNVTTLSGYTLRVGTSVYCFTGSLNAGGYILAVER